MGSTFQATPSLFIAVIAMVIYAAAVRTATPQQPSPQTTDSSTTMHAAPTGCYGNCTEAWEPVCASTGITYDNICFFNKAKRCYTSLTNVTVISNQNHPCPDVWREPEVQNLSIDCFAGCGGQGGRCGLCGSDGFCCRKGWKDCRSQLSLLATPTHHTCINFGGCTINCSEEGKRVCASNGITYDNICVFNQVKLCYDNLQNITIDTNSTGTCPDRNRHTLLDPSLDCWIDCGQRGGLCALCGVDGYCCRRGWDDCSYELSSVATSDHHTCIAKRSSSVTAKCSRTNMTAVVDDTLSGSVLNLTLTGCGDYSVTNNCVLHVLLHTCTSLTEQNDTISQVMVLLMTVGRFDPTNTIVRSTRYEIKIQCQFNRRLGITTSHTTNVRYRRENFVKEAETNYTAVMNFYTSRNFLIPTPSPLQVDSFEPIYILISGVHHNDLFTFVTEQCFATPTPNPSHTTQYLFFDERCPIDNSYQQIVSRKGEYGFSIEAFTFIRLKGEVYFHCKLLVCKADSTADECSQTCTTIRRRRRAAIGRQINEDRITVNSGAVQFRRKPTCRNIVCPANAHCVDLFPSLCRCNKGFVLEVDMNTCSKDKRDLLVLKNLHLNMTFHKSYSDAMSQDFLRLAAKVEPILMSELVHPSILGVKVTQVRKSENGRVVATLLVKYSKQSNFSEAKNLLLHRLPGEQSTLNVFRYVQTPSDTKQRQDDAITNNMLLSVLLPACCVVFLVAVFVLLRSSRKPYTGVKVPTQSDSVEKEEPGVTDFMVVDGTF